MSKNSKPALFASDQSVKTQVVVEAHETSKAMLHYYSQAEAPCPLHYLGRLVSAPEDAGGGQTDPEVIPSFIETFFSKSTQALRWHVIAMNVVRFLPISGCLRASGSLPYELAIRSNDGQLYILGSLA